MTKHLPAIDGLRAFAVLSVVAYHAGLPLSAGYVGVDVFFVISGYVITRMLLQEPRIDLLAFYARRVRRILPALLVVVAVVLALSAALLSADLQVATNRSATASMAMAANVWFQFHTGYFDAASDQMPLLHLWSLAVEEQFYLLWPLLLMLRRPLVLALLAVGSFALWQALSPDAAFYQMPARFWELAVGGLIAMAPKSRIGTFAGWAGLAVLALSLTSGVLLAVVGSALVVYGVHCGARLWPLERVRYVGLVSYSFYLWHWPLLAIAKGYSFDPPTLTQNLALCALAFGLACLSYHFVELPFRRANPPKLRAIALGVTACALLAGCAAVANPKPAMTLDASDFPAISGECHFDTFGAAKLPPASCGDGDVILWGDSHAYAWRPLADLYGPVYQMTRARCPPSVGGGVHACSRFNAMALERAKKGEVVILAARWSLYPTTDIAPVLDELKEVRVIVMGPLPEMPYPPAKCVAKDFSRCVVQRRDFDAVSAPIRAKLRAAVSQFANAEYVDPADYFCDATICPLLKNGRSLYWDTNHITASAAVGFARSRGMGRSGQ